AGDVDGPPRRGGRDGPAVSGRRDGRVRRPAVPGRDPDGTFGPDTCPNAGGLDQNIYAAVIG
ncbi:MAG: hypothetical protein ACRDPR_21605, partial [Nocardioidaceae bacterium]